MRQDRLVSNGDRYHGTQVGARHRCSCMGLPRIHGGLSWVRMGSQKYARLGVLVQVHSECLDSTPGVTARVMRVRRGLVALAACCITSRAHPCPRTPTPTLGCTRKVLIAAWHTKPAASFRLQTCCPQRPCTCCLLPNPTSSHRCVQGLCGPCSLEGSQGLWSGSHHRARNLGGRGRSHLAAERRRPTGSPQHVHENQPHPLLRFPIRPAPPRPIFPHSTARGQPRTVHTTAGLIITNLAHRGRPDAVRIGELVRAQGGRIPRLPSTSADSPLARRPAVVVR